MFARQLGWLHSKPGDSEMTRLELYCNEWDDWPDDIEPVRYIIDAAYEMRLGAPSSSGALVPHRWSDVVAFAKDVVGFTERWEFKALLDMSEAYVVELAGAKDVLRASPMDRFRRTEEIG